MTCDSIRRLALMSLTPVLAATAVPALAQDAGRVPGNKYVVVNQTSAPLTCRYRVNSIATGGGGSGWQDAAPIAAGAEFTRTAEVPGESVSLECSDGDARGKSVTVQPGRRYSAERAGDGRLVVNRVRS
jgi:hypothetical protein